MEEIKKFNFNYDYSLALIVGSGTETLIGGAEKIVEKALKDIKNPDLDIKGLDIYYREMPLGTFAVDVNQNATRAEIITEEHTLHKSAQPELKLETHFRNKNAS